MISVKFPSTVPQSAPGQTGATIHTPHLPIWFHRFRTTEEPDSDLEFEPADIIYPTNLAFALSRRRLDARSSFVGRSRSRLLL